MSLTDEEARERVIHTYPIYSKIFKKIFSGENINKEMDDLYTPLFRDVLIPNYTDLMTGSKEIAKQIKKHYTKENYFPLIEYLDFIYGVNYYEVFVYDVRRRDTIKYEHLVVFQYIIYVECIKYEICKKILKTLPQDSIMYDIIMNKTTTCIKSMAFCLKIIEFEYPDHFNSIFQCRKIIRSFNLVVRSDMIGKSARSFLRLQYYPLLYNPNDPFTLPNRFDEDDEKNKSKKNKNNTKNQKNPKKKEDPELTAKKKNILEANQPKDN